MSNELIPAGNLPAPFQRNATAAMANVNQGAVAIEQERAIAEAQGQLVLAKRFPRDLTGAHAELMISCKSMAFATSAFYSVPRAGGAVTGPSIRFAEEVARVFGNFQYGHRELSRSDSKSEVEVYAWDMERNNRSIRQLTVYHTRDTKNGAQVLRDQKDIDDKIANVASKQVRGRILALMPKWLVEEALLECRKTIAGNNDEPIDVRIRKMTQAFSKYGVKPEHLEQYLGHTLDKTLADELVDLLGVFNSIKEGTPASSFFGAQETAEGADTTAAAVADAVKDGEASRGGAMAAKLKAAENGKKRQEAAAKAQNATPVAEEKPSNPESNSVKQNDKPVEAQPEPTQAIEPQPQADQVADPATNEPDPLAGGDGDIF